MLNKDNLVTELKYWLGEDHPVVEMDGWEARGKKVADEDRHGAMVHHTVGVGDWMTDFVRDGRSDLPGPLYNILIKPNGTVIVVAAGKANHSGYGSSVVKKEFLNGEWPSGRAAARGLPDVRSVGTLNAKAWSFALEHKGDGTNADPRQANAAVKVAAMFASHYGPNSVISHAQWTRDKVDPRVGNFNDDRFRQLYQSWAHNWPRQRKVIEAAKNSVELYLDDPWLGSNDDPNQEVNKPAIIKLQSQLNERLKEIVRIDVDGIYGPATDKAVAIFQMRLGISDTLVGKNTWKALL